MSNESPAPLSTAPPVEHGVELLCPRCDYDLRGTPEDRCPECGQIFGRDRLVTWATGRNLPLTFERCDPGVNQGKTILWASLFAPTWLGRELPPFADRTAAVRYSLCIRVIAAIVGAGVAAPFGGDLPFALIVTAAVFLASLACESMATLLLARLARPRAVPRHHTHRFWRNLCHLFSAHLLITCGLAGLSDTILFWPFGAVAILAPVVLWWWLCLGKAVFGRALPSAGRTAAVLLIPVVALVAIVLGYALGVLGGFVAFALSGY